MKEETTCHEGHMRSEPFTRKYFHSEIRQLRLWMGDRTFWQDNKPGNAMRGLIYVYANTVGLTDSDVSLMTATTMEYDMRLAMVIGHGIYRTNAGSNRQEEG